MIRPATMDDLFLLFEWANEPEVRRNSFNQNEITIEEHKEWLESSLKNKDRSIYIMIEGGIPIGVIQYDRRARGTEVSISVDKRYRSNRYGIRMLVKTLLLYPQERVYATVKKGNIASLKLFQSAGFHIERDEGEYYELWL